MSFVARIRTASLALAAALAFLPARAQMDPRLQTTTTDLLDVYKVSSAKPEMLTVFDFSGSMHAVYWNAQYYTGVGQKDHNAQWNNVFSGNPVTGDDFPGLVPTIDSNGYIWMMEGTGYYQDIWTDAQPSQFQVDGSGKPTAQLIAPNGTVIPIPHTTTYNYASLTTLVLQATHIRVTATANVVLGGVSKSVTRTVDLPIPWALFDMTQTSTNNASATIYQQTDPTGGPSLPPDSLYQSQTNGSDNVVNNADSAGYMKIGRFHYNKDFLWWVFFGTDARNVAGNGSTDTGKFVIPAQNDSLGATYEPSVPASAPAASAPLTPTLTGYPATTWGNGLLGVTRFQALKYAALSAWMANQNKVWWGIRFLDNSEELTNNVNADNGNAAATGVSRDIRLFRPAANSSQANTDVKHFIALEPSTSTPLVYAYANAYAQLALTSDPSSRFGTSSGGGQSGTESPIPACRKSFVVVFTDGIANDGYNSSGDGSALGTLDPYQVDGSGTATLTEALGNAAINGYGLSAAAPSYASSNGGKSLFNGYTMAGIAAHYPTPKGWVGPGKSSYPLTSVIPFRVTTRGATPAAPRKIRTMTVGMSLAGTLADSGSGKADLYRAALYGNPDTKTWNMSTPPFDPSNPASDPTVNPFFFDATDPSKLTSAMTAIITEVASGSASIAAPASPLVGLSLGNQVYLGLFQTVKGPRWKGDLLMAGLYVGPQGVSFVDNTGNLDNTANAASNITDQNATWSANLNIFNNKRRTWKTRNLFTNLPGTTTLTAFNEGNATITAAMVGAPDAATRTAYIRFMQGAETQGETDPTDTTPRNDIMGDIINSAPTVLEYPVSTLTGSISPTLSALLGTVPSTSTPHFRVVFAGDNQGIFHAFGELSWTTQGTITFTTTTIDPVTGLPVTTTKTVNGQIPHGDVDELWAFIPGEYLQYISKLRATTSTHRYMVDGSPTVYFNDIPAAGQVRGNGVVDGSDVVRVVIGERKGGRSFYAFDFANLGNVVSNSGTVMPWKLVPDDVPSNTANAQQNVIRHMGFSNSQPAIGRVDTSAATNQDLLFIGGGLSTYAVDQAFTADATFKDASAKLGRSLIAFDVVTGPTKSLYTWDFTAPAFTTKFGAMGSVAAAVVPTEFFQGSGHTQRVYFTDTPTDANASSTSPRGGGIWALGNTGLATNGVIRLDSSSIDIWTGGSTANNIQGIRHIFQTPTGWSITTAPTPFLLPGPYPVFRTADPKTAPVAVGISFGTGDRNDPMDNDNINPAVTSGSTVTPYNNWVNVIFDRQDSASLSGISGVATTNLDTPGIQQGKTNADGDVADLTTVSSFTGTFNGYSVDPTNSAYYLKSKLGYKLNMGAATAKDSTNTTYFFPKVITNTVVLNGVLFFSDFLPSIGTNACQGTGLTNTYRICNVLQPTFNSGNTTASSTSFNGGDPTCSGVVLTYPNLPGEITALGTAAIIQSGQGSSGGQPGTIDNAGAKVGGSFGKYKGFGFAPRSWRIIR
ncbi:MAG TPA: hypothetical protein VFF76_01985 [Holophagaceae bacterium]|jgi:hypothetical protein|nr:hypothetical protein [Holophagaceae bacterium]